MKPAVVISAYNRPESLDRLLNCLNKADMPTDVPLIISIDSGGSRESDILRVAQSFDWHHGEKRVIQHDSPLGIVKHFHFCGSLAHEFGSIVKLEDDYYVSPAYYYYA